MSTSTAAAVSPVHDYPVHVEADLDPGLSRGLWLVKWLLAIPHYVVLAFLWVAFLVLSIVAFFAIVLTGRYPRAIFDFNVGVMRWSWRVAYYAYGALGTDRYPPFTLADVPDYPAHLDVDHPERLSRGLALVKWWLLAIPHYLVVGLFAGGLVYGVRGADDEPWISVSLIGALVLVAAVVLLFTGRYPREVFDLVLGLNRWVLRVAGYVALMTDEYPPFRLDQGGHEAGAHRATTVTSAPAPAGSAPARPPRTSGWTPGRVVSLVAGSLLVLSGLGLAGAGGTLAIADLGGRDDGFVMSPSFDLESDSFAITSEEVRINFEGSPSWVPDDIVGDVRLEARSSTPVFIGIASTADVEAYLAGVAHDTLSEVRSGEASYDSTPGGAPLVPPAEQSIWVAEATGTDATLDWSLAEGDWSMVLMRPDGSAGVSADLSTGAELPILGVAIAVLFVLAGLALLIGAILVAVPIRLATRKTS